MVDSGACRPSEICAALGIAKSRMDRAVRLYRAGEAHALGIPAVVLFPKIEEAMKSPRAEECYHDDGLVPRAIRALKAAHPGLCVITDVALDQAEGADMLMVKPAGPYLDIIARVRAATHLPVAAYQVSGEYLMIQSAAAAGWLDARAAALEALTGIKRAGADMILTYYAKQAARWLAEG